MTPTLLELAKKYSSDKLHWHSYIPMYERLFEGLEVKRLLEIGIGYKVLMQPLLPIGVEYVHGSSLKMFEEYFPEAQIFACDIREDTLVNEGRIRSVVCDQSDFVSLRNMQIQFGPQPFDVIIDDGSHNPEHQWFTAGHLLPRLRLGGIYIIEDVWNNSDARSLAQVYKGELILGEKGRDDNMVVIRR